MFFHAYMYGPLQGKLRLYNARDVRTAGKVMSSDWEVFASILVRDVGSKLGKGVDLVGNEVKSAEGRGSFEYQYHKDTGLSKLRKDRQVGHLFFSHENNLRLVELRYLHGEQLKDFFALWKKNYPNPYPQRYRKQIPRSFVDSMGTLLMRLVDGEVEYPKLREVSAKEANSKKLPSE